MAHPREAPPAAGSEPAAVRQGLAGLLPDLRAFARFLARDRVQADDLVQDTVVRALAAADQFQPGTNLKAWLFTILRNAFFEQARRRRRESQALRAHLEAGEAAEPPVSRADISDLQRAIWNLPPLLREALVLVGAQGLSYEEAADVAGAPVGTMKARVSRARARLARAVEEPAAREP